ncbi:serine hydrolase, partial [Vagococcus fessus]
WNKPYKYFDYKAIGKAKDHLKLNTDYKITRQAKTVNGIYYEAKPNVWVHQSAFEKLDKPAISNVNLETRLIKDGVFAWNKPYKYFDYKAIGKAKDHLKLNTDYKITRQAKTVNGIYYEAKPNVWVHYSAFKKLDKPAISKVSLKAKLKKGTVFAWDKPYNYFGYKSLGKAKDNLKVGTTYTIKRQAKTSNGIYYEAKPNVWVHFSAFDTSSEKMKKVQALLNKKYNSKNYGIYVKSLSNSSTAEMHANSNFYAASTGKLPAIYYTQKMINQGKLNGNTYYEKKYAINNMPLSYQPGGAGILQNYAYGSMHKLDTILNWTIKYSDNQGANFLGYYGASQFSQTMKNDISKIVGRTWYSQFNVTAKENAKLIEAIDAQGGNAVKYLQNTVYDNQRIPKYLPVKVGHKIGDLDDYRHDIAIVYAKEPYILAVMTQNYITYEQISILSKEIYDILK